MVGCAGLCIGLACTAAERPRINPARIYAHAGLHWSGVELLKPAETNTDELAFKLAPLLLQDSPELMGKQMARARRSQNGDFGKLTLTNGTLAIDLSRPAVYVVLDTSELNGGAHPRLTYLWFYAASATRGREPDLIGQGVRLTLSSAGAPIVWEELAEDGGVVILFASQSLEAAAKSQYGEPLEGRQHSLEPSLNQGPDTAVARVIEDGPLPMGPILYLSAGTHLIATLICRCMPAQADKVTGTRTYELIGSDADINALLERARVRCRNRLSFWPAHPTQRAAPLNRALRLPDSGW